jgi:stalled ribosome rescue protein Dom34
VEEAKRNEQIVVTPIVADLEGATDCYHVAHTIEKGDLGNAYGEKRKAYFEIGANRKERILGKAVRFSANNIMDSTIDHQMHGLGIIMNESCERSLAKYCFAFLNAGSLKSHP